MACALPRVRGDSLGIVPRGPGETVDAGAEWSPGEWTVGIAGAWGPEGVALVHVCVYIRAVKRKELERRLRELGWRFQRHGGKPDVGANGDGSCSEFVPRHAEISETLVWVIPRRAMERE